MIYFIFMQTSLPRESYNAPIHVGSIFLYYYLRQCILALSKTPENTCSFQSY